MSTPDPLTIEEAIKIYQTALRRQSLAEKAAEEYRVIDQYQHHKQFKNLIQQACGLSVKTNIARREMIKVIDTVVL